MEQIPTNKNITRKIASPKKLNHRRSRSFDINALNKTFSQLNVQSNVKSEKRGIDKINEIILGNEKYYIPEKPALNINTKTLSRMPTRSNSFKTPNSEVDYNELLKSLDDLTSEVKSNTIKRCKRNEKSDESIVNNNENYNKSNEIKNMFTNSTQNEIEEKNVNCDMEKFNESKKPTLKHSGSLRYLLNLRKKISNESLKEGDENNMPCFTDLLQNSKNYLFNLAKKTQENPEVSAKTEETTSTEQAKTNDNIKKEDETVEIPDIKITVNSRKSSESTIYKSDNDQCISTKRPENIEEEEEEDSYINQANESSVINLYSKNRDSINLDVYMNSEMFPKTPITPITPDNRLEAINENKIEEDKEIKKEELKKEVEIKKEKETIEEDLVNRKKFESLALPKLPPFNYGHKKSNSEVFKIPINRVKERSQMRRTYSKDNLESLKKQDVEESFEVISSNNNRRNSEVERNPVRHDSIRYSNSHSINLQDVHGSKRKSFLNQKNNNSNYLRKKQSGNRLSVNRSSINFQDMKNVKDVTKPFYINNKNFETTKSTDDNGKDVYYIRRLNNEDENDNAANIKLYRNTRKLSDVTKRQRSDSASSNASNRSLPVMNSKTQSLQYDKITISPKLMHKSSAPINKSSLSNQSFNADDDMESNKVLLSALPQEEDSLDLMTSNIDRDKSIEKMMNSLEAIKNSINGEKRESRDSHFRPSWARSSSKHNSYASNISNHESNKTRTPVMEERKIRTPMMEEKKSPEDNFYVASPQRKQYQSGGLIFSKRNSSLTRFSVVSARTRHSVAQSPDVALKSKYYRYSVARNMNTYNNPSSLPIPSHHTKLCIPHFNPNIMSQQPHQMQQLSQNSPQSTPKLSGRKDSINSVGSQETLTMEGSYNTNRVDSSIYNSNNSKSFLFRDTRENKIQNVSNIVSEIKDLQEDEEIEEPPLEFNFKSEFDDGNNQNGNDSSYYQFNNNNNNNISFNQNITNQNPVEKKAEIVSKINVTEIPFLYNKEQANWETNMHTMSLYDDQNPKPKKNKKHFRKTFSIFKKNRK